MNQFNYDWSQFKRCIFIKADKAQVFQAWLTADNITRWFIAKARYVAPDGRERDQNEPLQAGDTYFWEWHQDLTASGTILSVVENEQLSFTFGQKEGSADEQIVVTVRVIDEEDCTRLELMQANIAELARSQVHMHMGCNMGWSFFMTNLKGLLEYNVDLRETDPERAYQSRAINLV